MDTWENLEHVRYCSAHDEIQLLINLLPIYSLTCRRIYILAVNQLLSARHPSTGAHFTLPGWDEARALMLWIIRAHMQSWFSCLFPSVQAFFHVILRICVLRRWKWVLQNGPSRTVNIIGVCELCVAGCWRCWSLQGGAAGCSHWEGGRDPAAEGAAPGLGSQTGDYSCTGRSQKKRSCTKAIQLASNNNPVFVERWLERFAFQSLTQQRSL